MHPKIILLLVGALSSIVTSKSCKETLEVYCIDNTTMMVNLKDKTANVYLNDTSRSKSVQINGNMTVGDDYREYSSILDVYIMRAEIEPNGIKPEICILACRGSTLRKIYEYPPDESIYVLPQHQNEVGNVELRIRECNIESCPEVSNAYVGDHVYMFIKYMGNTNYSISPTNCTAYSGSIIKLSNQSLHLWDVKSCNSSEYFSQLTRLDERTLYSRVTVFRFTSALDLTITCNVLVCASCSQKHICALPRLKRKDHYTSISNTITLRIQDSEVRSERSTGVRVKTTNIRVMIGTFILPILHLSFSIT